MLKDALGILAKLEGNGYKAYIVGGYPRDFLLGIDSMDIDICTSATPKEIKEVMGKAVLPKEQYGSVRIITKNAHLELTTFRKDLGYIDNRRPNKVEYIDNLLEDLYRRDFTINTLCMNSKGEIIDLMDSKADLERRIIRMIGDPDIRLEEDSLRILRCIRLATTLNFDIEESLFESIKKHSYLIKSLSFNRKKEELEKIFLSKYATRGIKLLRELGIEESLGINCSNLVITSSIIGLWAQLNVLDTYPFTNNERDIINKVRKVLNGDLLDNRILYKYGLYICTIVAEIKNIDCKSVALKFDELPIKTQQELKISYNEICNLTKLSPGKEVKELYNKITNEVICGKLVNNHDVLTNYILEINNI